LRKIIKLRRKSSDVVIALRKLINSNNWSNAWIRFLAHGCVQHILVREKKNEVVFLRCGLGSPDYGTSGDIAMECGQLIWTLKYGAVFRN